MKAYLSSVFLSSLLLCLDPLLAQTPAPQVAATSDRANQARQPRPDHATRQLLKLLKMDAAELRDLRATLERIDSMPPEEKAMLRQRIKKMQAMDPQQIETLRAHFRQENIAALEGSGIDVDAFFPAAAPGRKARLLPETLDPALLLQLIVYMDERSG